jgi:hypothetical protein
MPYWDILSVVTRRKLRPSGGGRRLLCICWGRTSPIWTSSQVCWLEKPRRYHHGPSHSLGCAVLFGLAVSGAILFLKLGDFVRKSVTFFLLYFSHVILDYFSTDTSLPYGVPLLWPLSAEYYIAPSAFFPDVHRGTSIIKFIASFFSLHNLWAVTVESLMFIPLIFLMLVWNRRCPRSMPTSAAQSGGKGSS